MGSTQAESTTQSMTDLATRARRFGPILGLALVAFCAYAYFRVRYVGGCDAFAYLAQSRFFRGQDPILLELDPREHPALVPLCLHHTGAKLVSIFPVGFSLLLAAAGTLGLEFFLNPLLGAISVILIYAAVEPIAGRFIALAFAALWATTPIVGWGATMVMSDLPACVFVLASYLAITRNRPALSGALFAFGLGIRPTNVVAVPVLAYLALREKKLRPFVAALAIAGSYFVVYGFGAYGALFPPPYRGNVHELGISSVWDHLRVLLSTTFVMLWPVIFLGLVAIVKRPRESAPFVVWFAGYLGFYCLWMPDISPWWYTRYLLPAYPALFLLAARGACEVGDAFRARFGWAKRAVPIAATTLAAGAGLGSIFYARDNGVYSTSYDRDYAEDSRTVASLVPPGSLVAGLNFSGPLRFYGRLESFDWSHPRALELVDWALAHGRQVYLVIEPWEPETNPMASRFFDNYRTENVVQLTGWPKLFLKRIASGKEGSRPRGIVRIDIGTEQARSHLLEGWSGDETDGTITWAWALGHRSTVSVELEPNRSYALSLRASSVSAPRTVQRVEISMNGTSITTGKLGPEQEDRRATVPASAVRRKNLLELRFDQAIAPSSVDPKASDTRPLAAAVDVITFTPLEPAAP
jgi:hypothetical protein